MFRLTVLRLAGQQIPSRSMKIFYRSVPTFPQTPRILRQTTLVKNVNFADSNNCPEFRVPELSACCKEMTPTDLAFSAAHITQLYYEHLYATKPNLCKSIDWAFWQLMSTGKLHETMEPILEDRAMQRLIQCINEKINDFSPSEASDILLSLLRLSYSQRCNMIHKLLFFTNDHIPEMDIQGLSTMNGIFFASGPSSNIKTVHLVLTRLKELMRAGMVPSNIDSCLALCYIIKGMDRFMSPELLVECGDYLIHMQENIPACQFNVESIVSLIEVAPRLWAPSDDYVIPARHRVLNNVKQHLIEKIDELGPEHLECICYRLHNDHLFDENIKRLTDQRVRNIIETEDEKLPLRDIISLCGSLSERSDPWLIRLVGAHLYERMGNAELDAFNVSAITLALNRMKFDPNTKLIGAVQQAMMQNADQIFRFNFSPLFRRLTPFLQRYDFQNPDHQTVLAEAIVNALNWDDGVALLTESICYSMIFLLSSNGQPMDEAHYQKFLSLIPKMTNGSLYWVINAIQTLNEKHKISPALQTQLKEINQCLYRGILNKLDVSRFRSLYKVLRLLKQSNWLERKYLPFVHKMIDMHKKSMPATDEFEMKGLIKCCYVIGYFDEELCNDMTDACLEHSSSYTNLGHLVCFLGSVGYRPHATLTLVERLEILMTEALERNQMHHYLTTLTACTRMQCESKARLQELFTKEVLQQIGDFIKANPGRLRSMWRKLVTLNRHAMLLHPDLGVPWFCEGIAKQMEQYKQNALLPSPHIYHEMDEALKQVLGGREYYRPLTSTPYYCRLDFECVVNKKSQKPVKWTEASPGHTEDFQRVGICIGSEKQYCLMHPGAAEPHRLNGSTSLEHEHIRRLGYKLIVVPYYEWNSMGLSTLAEKCQYLEQRLFSTDSSPQLNYASNGH